MSDKSGVSNQVISLPKGGGALQGLGEKFSPDLHTGTGNFSVPIAVPSGRNGFQPQLTLAYSTGAGNGPFGLGWTLGVPGVSRRTAKGIPRYEDEDEGDVFVLSGAEDLVPVEHRPGRVRYRPRTEGLFALIERRRDRTNDVWEVHGKDGLVSVYGTPERRGDDPAALAKPDDPSRVFGWHLTETRDPCGNRIVYEYGADEGEADGHRWRRPLLVRISYGDYTDQAETRSLVSIAFEYEGRPDPFSDYRAGFEVRTTRRCSAIVTATHAAEQRLVRRHRLVYLDRRTDLPDLAERLPPNNVSLLSQVQVLGHDDTEQAHADLPALEFGYSRFEPGTRRDFFPLTGPDLPPGSLGRAEYELADLTGNGLPDILELNGSARYWANTGEGRFDLPRALAEAPVGVSLADPGVQMIDADGDGRIDLLVTSGSLNGYFPLQHNLGWDRQPFRPHPAAPSFSLTDPEVRLFDIDGDGVVDALHTSTRLEHYFNHPAKGWQDVPRVVERRPLEDFPDVVFSDPHVRLADMSGDGLQDIVRVLDGTVEYWPNLGHGNWGRRITTRDGPRLPYGYDPRRILLGDVDGDGLADLLYVDDGRVTLWVNRSGNGWSDPIVIAGTAPVTDTDAVRLVDLRGSGVSGVLWSADQDGLGRPRSFFLDLTGDGKPYLLDRMDNHLGAVTEVGYAASTAFRLADERAPGMRWRTPLPFPVQVVAMVQVTDVLSAARLTTEFRYHHGYWDGAEREFRGFGLVEQLDAESALTVEPEGRPLSPPTCTKTWFHQGPIGPEEGAWFEADPSPEFWADDPPVFPCHPELDALRRSSLPRRAERDALRALRGQVLRTELYALDGTARQSRPYTVTETWLSVREEEQPAAGDADRPRIFFAHEHGQRTTRWERGADPLTQVRFADEPDGHGQPLLQTEVACPRRWRALEDRPGQPYLATRSQTVYAAPPDPGPYLHDRVAAVTTREIVNDGRLTLAELLDRPDAALPVVAQTLNFYDRDPTRADRGAFVGLPLRQVGAFGALVCSERLTLTEALLAEALGGETPAYLSSTGAPNDGHPTEFLALLPDAAGYVDHRGGTDPHRGGTDPSVVPGLFVATERRRYDFHDDPAGAGLGLVVATRDPLGHETTIGYDEPYRMLPVQVTDPVGNRTTAAHDYRTLQPQRVTDSNANETLFAFTPLGLAANIQLRGKTVTDGDQARPSVRFQYDFHAYERDGQPISVTTIRHVHHDTETDVPLPERDEAIESREYSDGFGRVLQTRTQSEEERFGSPEFGGGDAVLPADQGTAGAADVAGQVNRDAARPNVLVSGWQVYDNKGRVVEKYEPFFAVGWEYAPPQDQQLGQRVVMVHDPVGRVVRTVHPDGSEQQVVHGVPADGPEHYEPTPWETYTYDANDNAGRTHSVPAAGYREHWDTPSSATVDALGRTVAQTERAGAATADQHTTRYTHDVRGNVLTITDALGRPAFAHVHDLLDRRLRLDSVDAGVRLTVPDAAGNPVETRNGRGAWSLTARDGLGRLTHRWARDRAGEDVTLRERMIYGDDPALGLTATAVELANLRGELHRHYDEAGRLTVPAYDLKGNPLEQVREVIDPGEILKVFDSVPGWHVPSYRVDWQPSGGTSAPQLATHAATVLDGTRYTTTVSYDALNRVKTMQYPADTSGHRPVLRPAYNRAGALERVEVDGHAYVERIAYDAKGQRVLVAHGNGVLTRLAYHATTLRLIRMRSESYISPAALIYRPGGEVLQDLGYEHDLAGNVLAIHDRTPGGGVGPLPDRLDRAFTYDPLYRLRTATGREADLPAPAPPWDDAVRRTDPTRTRAYTQDYGYDPIGNLTALGHSAAGGGFRRDFGLATGTNRLATLTVGQTTHGYAYDEAGNMVRENSSRHFEWDALDRLRAFRVQTAAAGGVGLAEPSQHAHYLYDGQGQRVMKLVRKQGGESEVTVYIGGVFEHHRWHEANQPRQSTRVHVMDGQSRIALVRQGDPYPDDTGPDVQYHLGDHLGNSHVVVGGALPTDHQFVAREEYYPYGETSFGSYGRKRYRFSGKERDEESGLSYFGARYYAPWLGRWASCDPAWRRAS